VVVDARRGLGGDLGEHVGGVLLDGGDARHHQPGGIGAVDSGGHEQVAVLDVGRHGHERHVDRAVLARAHGDRAQAVPREHHRHGLVLLGQECHFAGEGAHGGELPDDPVAVDDRHAGAGALREPLVEHELARVGIAAVGEHLGEHALAAEAAARRRHGEQVVVLGLQELRLLRGGRVVEDLRPERLVVAQQPVLRGEVVRQARERDRGGGGHLLQRVDEHGERQAHRVERAEAVVGDHRRHRQEREEGEARKRAGPAVEERRRLVDHAGPGVSRS
jgi:hypothetical protein